MRGCDDVVERRLRYAGSLREAPVEAFSAAADAALAAYEACADDLATSGRWDLRGRALSLVGLARHRSGDPLAAMETLEEAVALGERQRETAPDGIVPDWLVEALHRIAIVREGALDLAGALNALRTAYGYAYAREDPSKIARLGNSLGILLGRMGDHEAARERFASLHDQALADDDDGRVAAAASNLSTTLLALDRPTEALAAAEDAVRWAERSGDLESRVAAAIMRAISLGQAGGEEDRADAAFLHARDLADRLGYEPYRAELERSYGEFHLERGELTAAAPILQGALRSAERVGTLDLRSKAHARLAELHEAAGDLAASLRHLRAHHDLVVEMHREEIDRELAAQRLRTELAEVQLSQEALRARYDRLAREHETVAGRAAHLERVAATDPLTRVANRRGFDAHWSLADGAGRRELRRGLVVLDVDHFKRVNDAYGHAVGDGVLRELAECVRDVVRESDLVARTGGEEFAVILDGASAQDAARVGEAIRRAVADRRFEGLRADHHLSVSVGVATSDEAGGRPEAALDLADQRLYAAKRAGRNRVVASGDPSSDSPGEASRAPRSRGPTDA